MSDDITMAHFCHAWRSEEPHLTRGDTITELDGLRTRIAAPEAENKLLRARIVTMGSTTEELRRIGTGR